MAVSKPMMMGDCSICLEGFETPKVLSCGHTFCLPCIDPIISRGGLKPTLACPACGLDVDLPGSGRGEDLPTNFQLLSMLDDIQREGEINAGVTVEGGKCLTHGEENEFYCERCKTLICSKCMRREHKLGQHDIIAIEDFVERQEEIISKVKERLSEVEAIRSRVESRIGEKEQMLLQDIHALQKRITTASEEACRELGQNEASLSKDVLDAAGTATNEYEEFRQKLACHVELMQELGTATEYLRQGHDADGLNQEIEDLSRDLEELEACTGSLTTSLCFSFTPSNMKYQVGSLQRSAETIKQGADIPPQKPPLRRRLLHQLQGTSSARGPPRPRKPKHRQKSSASCEEEPATAEVQEDPDDQICNIYLPYEPAPFLEAPPKSAQPEQPQRMVPPSLGEEEPVLPSPKLSQPEAQLEQPQEAIHQSPQGEPALSSETSANPRQAMRQQPQGSAPSLSPGDTELFPERSPAPLLPPRQRMRPLSAPGDDFHGSAQETGLSPKRTPPQVLPKPRRPSRPLSAPGRGSQDPPDQCCSRDQLIRDRTRGFRDRTRGFRDQGRDQDQGQNFETETSLV